MELPCGKLISLLSMAARGGFKPFMKMLELSAGVHFGAFRLCLFLTKMN